MKIRKGDTVVVIRGEDKGKTGKVLSVDPKKGLVVVQRVRLVERHKKGGQQQLRQGTVEKELPIAIGSVALIDPKSNKPTRVRTEIPHGEDSDKASVRRGKVRLSIRSGVEIEKPVVKS